MRMLLGIHLSTPPTNVCQLLTPDPYSLSPLNHVPPLFINAVRPSGGLANPEDDQQSLGRAGGTPVGSLGYKQ